MVEEFPVKVNIKTEIDKEELDRVVKTLERIPKSTWKQEGREYFDRAFKRPEGEGRQASRDAKSFYTSIGKASVNMDKVNDLYSKYRKSLTGVLIDLHFLRIIGQSSRVVNRSFEALSKTLGALLDVILIPMMPIFMVLVQGIQQLASIILRMPAPLRLVISALMAFGVALFATMTIMKSLVGFTAWAKSPTKRASGGPLSYGQAAIVGEKGPELMIPTSGGYHVVPNNQLRFLAEGTEGSTDLFTSLTGGILGFTSGAAEATGTAISGLVGKASTQNLMASMGIIGGTIGAILAPFSGMIGAGGIMVGGFTGVIKAVKSSGQSIVASITGAAVGLRNILTLILLTSTKAGIGALAGISAAAIIEGIIEDLKRLWDALKSVYELYIKPVIDYLKELYNNWVVPAIEMLKVIYENTIQPFLDWLIEKVNLVKGMLDTVWDFLGFLKESIIHYLGLDDNPVVNFLDWLIDKILVNLGLRQAPETELTKTEGEKGGLSWQEALGAVVGKAASNTIPLLHQAAHGFSSFGMIPPALEEMFTWEKSNWGQGIIPSYAEGGYVPNTGLAYLHAGETVVPKGQSGNISVTINVSGSMDQRTTQELIRQLKLELTKVRA